jgi:gamma-glutamyltranspeptidase/glutathione hydrolase
MRGAIAAGHEITALAGARALEEGGNAVDACIAAAFASWVAESPLTGPGAGGFMLVHRAHDRSLRLLDFFVAAPGQGGRGRAGEMDAVDIPFESGTDATQRFLIGHASCAVPGTVAGLAEAHRVYGTLPWSDLLAPAIELARSGVVLTKAQALLHALLDSILRHTPESRAVYGQRRRLTAGDRLVATDLAGTLEAIAAEGPDAIYRGDIAAMIARHVSEHGGAITRQDLESYRVIRRRPVATAYRGHVFASNPPPSSGGVLIGYASSRCCASSRAHAMRASHVSFIEAGLRAAC